MVSVLVGCCLLLVAGHLTNGAVLTVAPVSVTVLPFTLTNFTCEGNGDTLTWTVNNSPLDDTISQQRNITATNTGDLSSALSIVALPINDGIEIGCIIASSNPFQVAAGEATLSIRGSTPIEELNLNFSSDNSLIVSWSPPVYYAPAGFPLFYQIAVVNEEGGFIRYLNLSNVTLIEIANVTECDTFNVSITAFIGQYASATTTERINGSCSIDILNYSVFFDNITAYILVNCVPLLCSRIVLVEATYDNGVNTLQSQFVINKSNGFDQLLTKYTLKHLETFQHYNITFKLLDLRRNRNSITVSTFYVQGLNISSDNDFVSVKCIFIEGSTVEGCHVTFTDMSLGLEESFNITGSGGTQLSLQYSGNYTVTVYDIVNGSIIGPAFQYPIPIEFVISVLPSPSFKFHTHSMVQNIITSEDSFKTSSYTTMDITRVSTNSLMTSMNLSNQIIILVTTSVKNDSDQQSSNVTNIAVLSTIIAVAGVVTCTVVVIALLAFSLCWRKERKKIKRAEEITEINPAYGQLQVAQMQQERIESSINPAYSTIMLHHHNVYETVF